MTFKILLVLEVLLKKTKQEKTNTNQLQQSVCASECRFSRQIFEALKD